MSWDQESQLKYLFTWHSTRMRTYRNKCAVCWEVLTEIHLLSDYVILWHCTVTRCVLYWWAQAPREMTAEESSKVVPICNTKYNINSHTSLDRAVSLAKDGAVDYQGRPINKNTSGRLKANCFIIGKLLPKKPRFSCNYRITRRCQTSKKISAYWSAAYFAEFLEQKLQVVFGSSRVECSSWH